MPPECAGGKQREALWAIIVCMSCVPEAVTKHSLDFFYFAADILEQGIAWAPFCSAPLGSTEREVDDYYDLS